MFKIRKIIIGIFAALLLADVSSAAVDLAVSPGDSIFVRQGETINYTATVTLVDQLDFPPQEEIFSIEENDKQPGWNYSFNPESVTLENVGDSKSSILTIRVPRDAQVGNYSHTVIATGYDALGREMQISTELDMYIINTPVVPIPELSTAILTLTGLLGILLISRRRN